MRAITAPASSSAAVNCAFLTKVTDGELGAFPFLRSDDDRACGA
jgi:hypothetical protein